MRDGTRRRFHLSAPSAPVRLSLPTPGFAIPLSARASQCSTQTSSLFKIPTLLPILDVFAGLTADGYALVNSSKSSGELGLDGVAEAYPPGHVITMPATDIAREYTGRTVPNAVLLGGMAALAHPFKLESVNRAIRERFPGKVGEMNVAAAEAAYRYVGEKTGSTATKEVRLDAATN